VRLSWDSQTQFHYCCVSIGVVFFTGIGGDINIASWAFYKFIELSSASGCFTRSPAVVTKIQGTGGAAIVNHSHLRLDVESDSSSHPAISLSAGWRNSRAVGVRTPGKLWLRERTGRGHKLLAPRTVPSFHQLDVTGRINDVEALWCSLLARWIEKGGGSVINAVRDAWVLIVGRIHGRLTRRLQPSLLLLQ
jgi:hypothetical protein